MLYVVLKHKVSPEEECPMLETVDVGGPTAHLSDHWYRGEGFPLCPELEVLVHFLLQ